MPRCRSLPTIAGLSLSGPATIDGWSTMTGSSGTEHARAKRWSNVKSISHRAQSSEDRRANGIRVVALGPQSSDSLASRSSCPAHQPMPLVMRNRHSPSVSSTSTKSTRHQVNRRSSGSCSRLCHTDCRRRGIRRRLLSSALADRRVFQDAQKRAVSMKKDNSRQPQPAQCALGSSRRWRGVCFSFATSRGTRPTHQRTKRCRQLSSTY